MSPCGSEINWVRHSVASTTSSSASASREGPQPATHVRIVIATPTNRYPSSRRPHAFGYGFSRRSRWLGLIWHLLPCIRSSSPFGLACPFLRTTKDPSSRPFSERKRETFKAPGGDQPFAAGGVQRRWLDGRSNCQWTGRLSDVTLVSANLGAEEPPSPSTS